jgi:dTDP-4-amino-4,6-dideoxygalactose transaminase
VKVPFNLMHVLGDELEYVQQAVRSQQLSGNGPFVQRCEAILSDMIGGQALLVPSATAALELASMLLDLGPGNEVIMPSFTFVSAANAVRLRGSNVQFCDIEPTTMNLDAGLLEGLITEKTKAVYPIDYAGVGCDILRIMEICRRREIVCVQDSAQGIGATRDGKPLGSLADLSVFSFHESKNLGCGEGGCLVLNDSKFVDRARILRDKGTNRHAFLNGQVDKYTWVDFGSSYILSELAAAFLLGQLEHVDEITNRRRAIWNRYSEGLLPLRKRNLVSWNDPPNGHNAHIFYMFLESEKRRDDFIRWMAKAGVKAFFHYVPLHLSPVGQQLGYARGDFPVTEDFASRLVRLPLYYQLGNAEIDYTVGKVFEYFGLRNE